METGVTLEQMAELFGFGVVYSVTTALLTYSVLDYVSNKKYLKKMKTEELALIPPYLEL